MYRAADHIDEARFIAREVQRRFQLADDHEEIEIAVLYRMNALSRNLEFALRELGIEYIIYGGTRLRPRRNQDVTAYLSLIQSPRMRSLSTRHQSAAAGSEPSRLSVWQNSRAEGTDAV